MKAKGKPKDVFAQAINDIDSFVENPDGFSALFEPKPTIQKKKASPKPKKQDVELDFDSLKSDSSVPSSPNIVTKTPQTTPAAAPKRSISTKSNEKPKIAEKTPKVPVTKRKATRESEPEEAVEAEVPPAPPSKKPRKTSQAPIGSPQRNDSTPDSTPRRSFANESKAKTRAPIEASRTVFGFIGLGILGKSILHNILKAGHDVVIWNRTMNRCDEFVNAYGSQCTSALSPKDVCEAAQITFVCVSDSEAVKLIVCDGDNGVSAADNLSPDKGLVMLSSIDCETSQYVSEAISIKGPTRYLEAMLQGSRNQANDGSLIVIASGDQSLYDDCRSCFTAISKDQHYLGEELGAALKMNLVLQTFAGVQLAAVAEAFALADSFKLQLGDILEIISISNLNSDYIMEKGNVIINEDFCNPSMKINTMQKDLKMAIEFGDASEQPLPLATTSNEIFKSAKRLSMGQDDVASIYVALKTKYGPEANGI